MDTQEEQHSVKRFREREVYKRAAKKNMSVIDYCITLIAQNEQLHGTSQLLKVVAVSGWCVVAMLLVNHFFL
jgi:hypothetical protein